MNNKFAIIGYSGHSFVILDSASKIELNCTGYYDINTKEMNPFDIDYLGLESNIFDEEIVFVSIGDNFIRRNIYESLMKKKFITFINIFDPTSSISKLAVIEPNSSISIGVNAVVNSMAQIDTGVIINTGAIIEHEVKIGKFSHVGPNSTVCGGSTIGENVFIGANAVIKQGVQIGDNSIIGAGSVVLNNIPMSTTCVGNPAVKIK